MLSPTPESVLVIEYGFLDNDPSILIPIETFRAHPSRMYNITSVPQLGLSNRTSTASVGAVVGGGSAVNGMFLTRGSASDYDAWEMLGNPGWGWSSLLPYFKKSVTFTPPSRQEAERFNYTWDETSAYGGVGPVQESYPPWAWPASWMYWEAWKGLGVQKQKEGANGKAYGVYHVPSALDPVTKTRSYARTAHYDPFVKRPNYELLTGYQVTEVRLEGSGNAAVEVNVVKRGTNGPKIAIQAKRETIVAAGAIWTPWLLQRSGIGPRAVLEKAGIEVKLDMPGVGANFQDHPTGGARGTLLDDIFPSSGVMFVNQTFTEAARVEYETNRTGPFTASRGNQAAFLPLKTVIPDWEAVVKAVLAQDPAKYLPSTYDKNLTAGFIAQKDLTAKLFGQEDSAVFEYPFGAGYVGGTLQRPLSRGTINLNPSDPSGNPLVDYRTFSNPIDVANTIAMFRYARKFMTHPALQSLRPVETVPGANVTSDADIEKALRDTLLAPSFAHPCGTASMLPEEFGGVVGPDLRVYNTQRLSVVDASIIPFIPAAHLTTTVYAVAEKAADLIKDRTDW
ncbi:GMC oxidoreductase [Amniculicola lignicola CBS 123094]|uniref:GMC oxidoreductase n=1 Tax=Amniculicola lignicola CBS 123094 TaxID=1392246 RepID=A0A6A5WZA4_9PLEO|nr:GMC oxidoreductase [Amniculicola lignicola CBS 123094]